MPEPIREEPAGIGNDRGQQIVTTSPPEATQPKDANGEIGECHFILEWAIRPADLLGDELAKRYMHCESIQSP